MTLDELRNQALEAARKQQQQRAQGRAVLAWKIARQARAGGGEIEGLEFSDLQFLTPGEYLSHKNQVNRILRETHEQKNKQANIARETESS